MSDSTLNLLNEIYDASNIDIERFQNFPIQVNRTTELLLALDTIRHDGLALEFGVFKGKSIRIMAERRPEMKFHGFDSFEGLPEAWVRSEKSTYNPGHFAVEKLPNVPANVRLFKGFFENTLPGWKDEHPDPVSFIHVDCDLYGGAKYALSNLVDRITDPVVVVFDELSDWKDAGVYPNWREGEWRALCEWLKETGLSFRILSRSEKYEAAIEVFRTPPQPLTETDVVDRAKRMAQYGDVEAAIKLLTRLSEDNPSSSTIKDALDAVAPKDGQVTASY